METKVCKTCNVEKNVDEYHKAGGGSLQPYCKPCDRERKREWNEKNKERLKEKSAERYKKKIDQNPNYLSDEYSKNRDKIIERNKAQQKKFKDKINARNRGYRKLKKYKDNAAESAKRRMKERIEKDPDLYKKIYKKRKDKIDAEGTRNEYNKKQRESRVSMPSSSKKYELSEAAKNNRRERNRVWSKYKNQTDICFRLAKNLRSRTRLALKAAGAKKADSLVESMLGCSIEFFKDYFCSLFTEGMTWELFMAGEVHIDHIIACKHFDLTKEEEQRLCFSYLNLQPLWEKDNLSKGAKKYEEWILKKK